MSRRRSAALTAAAVLLILWAITNLFEKIGTSLTAIDYDVFWRTVRAQRVYGTALPFPYPPTGLLWFQPLRLVPYELGFMLWSMVSIALFAFAVSRISNIKVALLSLFSIPAVSGLNLGQTSMLLASLVILGASTGSVGLGLALGVVGAIKPQLVLMAPFILLLRRDFVAFATAGGTTLALCVLATGVFGLQLWREWFDYLESWQAVVSNTGVQVITPKGYAEAHGLPGDIFWIAGAACCTFLIWRRARDLDGLDLVALIFGTSIMSAPYAVHHDAIGIVPALAAYVLARNSWKAAAPIAILAGFYQGPVLAAIGAWVGKPWQILQSRTESASGSAR